LLHVYVVVNTGKDCHVGDRQWSITDELSATQLATLQQLDARLKYEIKVTAKSSASDDDIASDAKLISFGPEPGKLYASIICHIAMK